MSELSLVIITRNEAHNLAGCIESVPCADEVVVVDAQSTDDTRGVAAAFTDKVYDVPWEGFGKAKQHALQHATRPWVLSLDADERLDPQLADALCEAVRHPVPGVNGYRLNRLSNFLGTWIRHSGWYPDFILRLGRREHMRVTPDPVHERIEVEGRTATLGGHLLHYTDPTLEAYFAKLHRYADLSARMLHARGRRARAVDVSLRPLYQFLRMYVARAGFLDGLPGLLLAGGSAFHVFAKYARLWELDHRGTSCSS